MIVIVRRALRALFSLLLTVAPPAGPPVDRPPCPLPRSVRRLDLIDDLPERRREVPAALAPHDVSVAATAVAVEL